MSRLFFGVFATLLFAFASVRQASADELFTGPAPAWVQMADLPEATPAVKAAARDGVLYLLSDEQTGWVGEERQTHSRLARLVTDRIGLEHAATLQFVYAPEYETITLTRLVVIRGAEVIDHTETVMAEILGRDAQTEGGVLNGNLTAVVQIPDLRVGDIVDFAYLRRGLPVVDLANRAGKAILEYDVPVVMSRVVLNWPKAWPVNISGWPARVTFSQTEAGDVIVQEWVRRDHVPLPAEPFAPAGYSENTVISYSAFADWREIVGALSPHYTASYPLGADWDAKLRDIQASDFSDEGRVIAALRAVQDDLRYVGLSVGAGGYLARTPAEVTQSGFGDGKDKALLLRTMLDKMGIEAYVALTDLDEGHALNGQLPSLWAFDHAIVKVVVAGTTYWFDPTRTYQRGDIYSTTTPDFGFALPLAADQQSLELIVPMQPAYWNRSIDQTYRFSLLGAYLTVTTTLSNEAADSFRQRRAGTPDAVLTEEFLTLYAKDYPGLRSLGVIDVFDEDYFNSITVTERYLIPATALTDDLMQNFVFRAEDFVADLPAPGPSPRVAPLDLGYLRSDYHRVFISNAPVNFSVPEPVSVYNDVMSFSFAPTVNAPGDVVLDWSYYNNARIVAPESVDQVLRDARVISDNSTYTLNLLP